MKSKITIDLDNDNQPVIKIDYQSSEDVRDKMVSRFFGALDFGSNWCTIEFTDYTPNGSISKIRPIRVSEMKQNALEILDRFNTEAKPEEKPKKAAKNE